MSPRTGSLPHYLQDNCLSPEQMKIWWAKRAQQAREQEHQEQPTEDPGEDRGRKR